ncbi:MAG TPA: flagellar filament capping protein FliD [Firmicutes bacterium]|jgi:flagellar hook-associated protein 2|nr:flagellar filament capping protein FliD [Bacillota bacterium]
MQNLRVGGLASGIDTDAIVRDLMQVARAPVDRLYRQKQLLSWQQEDYREINKALLAFRDTVFAMRLQSTYLTKIAASSDPQAVAVTAAANAQEGVYQLGVRRLATGITLVSAWKLGEETGADGRIVPLSEQFGLAADQAITFTLQGKARDGLGGYKSVTIDCLAGEATIYDLVQQINQSELGLQASYDAQYNRFAITSSGTGESQRLFVQADASGFLNSCLGLSLVQGDTVSGQNAEFSLAGSVFESESNDCQLLGLSFTLKNAPANWAPGDEELAVTVQVGWDGEGVAEQIESFVQAYNDLLAKINAALAEERYSDYPPLTEKEKEGMTERQIELWEEKARSGLLKGDMIVGRIAHQLRAAMGALVEGLGSYRNLAALGITTSSYDKGGILHVDGDRLRAAVAKDPQAVMALFTQQAGPTEAQGVAQRVYEVVNRGIGDLSAVGGRESSFSLLDNSYLGRRLRELDEKIERWEDRLVKIEDRYWREFTVMEQAISRMNAQSAWLSQQFNVWWGGI